MAYSTLTTVYGNPNSGHYIKIEYDLTGYTATTFSVDIRLTYYLSGSSNCLYTKTGYSGSDSNNPYIRFSTEDSNRPYARGSTTGSTETVSGPWHRVFYEHSYNNITRNGSAGQFTLTISGRERIINELANTPLENVYWSGTITIPAATYTVTYHKNYSPADSTTRTTNSGTSHSLISCPSNWLRTGWDFLGWNTNSSGTGTHYNVGATVSSAITLYAEWELHSYTITYYRNSSTSDTQKATSSALYNTNHSLISLATTGWTRPGYKFLGWGTSKTATSYSSPGTSITVTSDRTYYAIWQPYCVRISDGEDFDNKYVAYIYTTYNGTEGWYPHAPYIYNGSSWEPYGG